ncbi:2Fe-2S iron-sulfur cluster binding domain-containing protein [Pseudooceanicola sp. GBMRC 2024]|uniref:2Fe-2S iron-sulfur cluster binding domain-containing protein n=1 Tax=Pseudooceanicola albus TaxID=2692189 RepID=A0A6L7G8X1_9RHOB|nr:MULTISPECIES: PDR/VanB family oxidoreductase [Pseudooceanicola]MXN20531.1 2Fe-2S iron-sulfur cluster binding domain-containing protein [Pseudooceanicola albus]
MSETTLTLIVTERQEDRGDILRLTLADPSGAALPEVRAGAHVDILVPGMAEETWRQYSLAGDPARADQWQLGILKDPASRGGSVALHGALVPGTAVQITGPRNHFALVPARKTVLLGGGVGVTPMLAMAHELAASGAEWELHYCTRAPDCTAFADLLDQPPFAGHVTLHHGVRGLDPKTLLPAPAAGTHLYICGPEGFMEHILTAAEAMGHTGANVHREYFSAEVDLSGDSFEVECAQSGVTVTVGAEESIVTALARAGIKVEVKCEEGICGTCLTDVLDGTPDHRDHFLTDEEKEENTEVCLCCSRAKSARLVLDL